MRHSNAGGPIEIINNIKGGIQCKIWERANGGQIQDPDVLSHENCTNQTSCNIRLSAFDGHYEKGLVNNYEIILLTYIKNHPKCYAV